MSNWLEDHDLFLYAKGTGSDDVHLWRCKKPVSSSSSSSSLVMPMKSDDFDYVSNVENHLELIDDLFDWDETDYKRLVKYIFERRLLVNSQGFVIAELLHKVVDQDGSKMIDDANKKEVSIYIRSLDVLALKPYIPKLRERPIPLRTVRILEDVNGKAAVMEEDSKLTARVEHLEGKVTRLTTDLATALNTLATLQRESKENHNYKEVWMNDLTHTEWVGFEKLKFGSTLHDKINIIKPKGTFTSDDNSTNVRAGYYFTLRVNAPGEFKAVSVEDLTPNKENARFSQDWWCIKVRSQEKTELVKIYILRNL